VAESTSPVDRVVDFDGTGQEWDGFLQDVPSTFCHLYGWRAVMEETFGHDCHYMAALDTSGSIRGILPLVRVRSRLFGDYLMSMPFLNYGGPAGTAEACQELSNKAVERAQVLGVDLLELRAREPLEAEAMSVSDRKLTVLLPLPETSEELWTKGIKAKVRSQVRRPMKEGMTSRFGLDLVGEFYGIFSTTMRDLGTPVLPRLFFESLVRNFPDQVIFSVVDHEGEPAAASCGFLWAGEYEITWAGARRDLNRLAPNMLLYWSLMEESIARGAHTFNFGRCSPDSGTHRFKKQWGSEDHPLPWAQFSPSGVIATPNPDSTKFRLATRVWSRLPVPVANAFGPLLARSLP